MPHYSNNQESLYNIAKTYSKIVKSLNEALNINQTIVDNLSPCLLETATLTKNINMEYNGILTSCVEQLQPLLAAYNLLPQNLITNIEHFSSVSGILTETFRSIDFDSLLASAQSENTSNDSDDYVITDSPIIRDIDFPDNIVIPMGHNRLRIRTDIFITLISVLVSVFASIFQNIGTKDPQENTRLLLEQNQLIQEQAILDQKQNQLLQEQNQLTKEESRHLLEQEQLTREQNQLLWEQNQILLEILESVDTSESSQADFIKDMKESLQEQASLFQMPLESAVAAPESAVAVQESGDPTQEATDLTQKADDSTQPTTDTSLPTPSTGYDNE